MNSKKLRLAVTTGDPAGIGPEITIKAVSSILKNYKQLSLIVVCNENIIAQCLKKIDIEFKYTIYPEVEPGKASLLSIGDWTKEIPWGLVDEECGEAAFSYIETAINLALAGEVDGVVTGPVNKESFKAANVPFIGHTEIFGELCNVSNPLTMFETLGLKILFLSRHLSLSDACKEVTKENLERFIPLCFDSLEKMGIEDPTIAVAGLNPHCGEHGLFGMEEVKEIEPAIHELKQLGYNVYGPIGADSVFHQCKEGNYSAVISLYHDQGHIAAKTLNFHKTISITLRLPFLRTSVDHGTAFDIAGSGIASETSMIAAIESAIRYIN